MFKPVIDSLHTTGSFSGDELLLFESKLSLLSVSKNDYILKEGTICQTFYFMLEGSSTHFISSPDGTENIVNLYTKNNWFTDYKSVTSQKPALGFIRAFEDCELATLTIHSFHHLVHSHPLFLKQVDYCLMPCQVQIFQPLSNRPKKNILTSWPKDQNWYANSRLNTWPLIYAWHRKHSAG